MPVEMTYILKRALKTPFGDKPLPGGTARIYNPDSDGRLQLVGEASFGHSAAGEDVSLYAGNSFDLTAKRVQTEYTTVPGEAGQRHPHHRDARVQGDDQQRIGQHPVGGRARGAGRGVVGGDELGAGGEGVVERHPLQGDGAGEG